MNKIKTVLLVIFSVLLISLISITSAETQYHNGSLQYNLIAQTDYEGWDGYGAQPYAVDDDLTQFDFTTSGISISGIPKSIHLKKISMVRKVEYFNIPQNVGGAFVLIENGGIYGSSPILGTGSMYIRRGSVDGDYDIDIYFDDNCEDLDDTNYDVYVYSSAFYVYFTSFTFNQYGNAMLYSFDALGIAFAPSYIPKAVFHQSTTGSQHVVYNSESPFRNDYSIKIDGSLAESTINRNVGSGLKESSFVLKDDLSEIVMNSGNSIVNKTYYHVNGSYNYYLYTSADTSYHLIYSNTEIIQEITNASLSLDKSEYIINESIEFTYSNLDELGDEGDTYSLQYYYYTSQDTINYLYTQSLLDPIDNYNGIGTTNTTGWTPKKLYYGIINNKINYKLSKSNFLANVRLNGYVNLTYSYEYINDSCTGGYCSYNNGDTVVITYNTFVPRNINILDNNDNIVQVLSEVDGFGSLNYAIPFDDDKHHSYPGWKITMGSYEDSILVMWQEQSEYQEYIQDDEYLDKETVVENIDTLQDSIEPIMELIIGCGGIILEDPDYDNNGIVGSDELDQWFNSIIGLLIVVTIYVLYKGLKDR